MKCPLGARARSPMARTMEDSVLGEENGSEAPVCRWHDSRHGALPIEGRRDAQPSFAECEAQVLPIRAPTCSAGNVRARQRWARLRRFARLEPGRWRLVARVS